MIRYIVKSQLEKGNEKDSHGNKNGINAIMSSTEEVKEVFNMKVQFKSIDNRWRGSNI